MVVGVHVRDEDDFQIIIQLFKSLLTELPAKLTKRSLSRIEQDSTKAWDIQMRRRDYKLSARRGG